MIIYVTIKIRGMALRRVFILFLTFILFLFLSSDNVFLHAQDNDEREEDGVVTLQYYSLGDQMFSINLGLLVPLFFHNPEGGITKTNLSLGGAGSLEWDAFLNNNLSLGGELGGGFTISPLKRVLIMIPITVKMSYFIRKYPFEFPLFLSAGICFTKLDDLLYIGPIVKPGFSAYWNITPQWAIGINAAYWWVPEFYLKGNLKEQARFGNFAEFSLSGLYHF